VVNGRRAYSLEISKALQLSLLDSLGLPHPRSLVVNCAGEVSTAATALRFPVVVKPNIGGSGAGIVRFDSPDALALAARSGGLQLGLDSTALVQECLPARGGYIVRVEVLGGKFLYAIKVHLSGDTFNLCPAEICQGTDGTALTSSACPADAPKSGIRAEAYTPPPEVVRNVERITAAAGIEVGGVEYLVDDRDGSLAFYDINALSNFVADAERVVGFDPHARLVDYLEQARAGAA
jgi:glutathione synthase/RimK-type ligase-like ATP-grasp enzyme